MAYVQRAQVTAKVPAPILNDALDDDGDGTEDAGLLDQLIANASQAVNAPLSGIYNTPFPDPAPPAVCEAALIFTLEGIYGRRPTGAEGKNPWTSQANAWRKELEQMAKRNDPTMANYRKAFRPGAVHVEHTSINTQSS